MESHLMGLTVDFSMGFVCFDAASKVGVGRSVIIRKTKAKTCFQWGTFNNCILHSLMRLITIPRLSFFFFSFGATNLFCTVCNLGVWAHLFWRLISPKLKYLTPACNSFWPYPKSESHTDYSTGAYYVDEQDTSSAILFSKILALIPTMWSNNVPQGGEKCCQRIVYREKCTKHNPYVHFNHRQYTGWDYSVIKSCYWQMSKTMLELVSFRNGTNRMTSWAVICWFRDSVRCSTRSGNIHV